jgi:RHS repeat-associated protein
MKPKLTLALLAVLASPVLAAMPKVLPEFKNEKQLTEWRAQMAVEANAAASTPEDSSAFYTGKPYIAPTATYAFKYRSYNPELARWTSEDPSGFPDGANGNIYAPCPTFQLDWLGLAKLDAEGGSNLFSKYYDYDTYPEPRDVYARAGGWLLEGYDNGDYVGSCALRLSIGLNDSGNTIPAGPTANLRRRKIHY